jgi:predicted nucleic acid-binding protein
MYLLDTNVVSELRKLTSPRTDAVFAAWGRQADISRCYLSVITIQELEIGHLRLERRDRERAALLRDWFHGVVLRQFVDRILPVDLAAIRRSSYLHVAGNRDERDTFRDTLIAATAYVRDMTVVTRNVADFKDAGVQILNPWESQP